eukprot:7405380-Pyramimonas_sp.AAC.1
MKHIFLKPVSSPGFLVEAAVFQHRAHGARVWFDFSALYRGLGLNGSPAEYYNKCFGKWAAWFDAHGLAVPHVRRATKTGHDHGKLK